MALAAQLDKDGFYIESVEDYGGPLPYGALKVFPPDDPLPEHQRWRFDKTHYRAVPDYRGIEVYDHDGKPYRPDFWGELPPGHTLAPPPPALETLRERATQALRRRRDRAVEQGLVQFREAMHSTSAQSQHNIASMLAAGLPDHFLFTDWKAKDPQGQSVWLTMSLGELRELSCLVVAFVQSCRALEREKAARINGFDREALQLFVSSEMDEDWPA